MCCNPAIFTDLGASVKLKRLIGNKILQVRPALLQGFMMKQSGSMNIDLGPLLIVERLIIEVISSHRPSLHPIWLDPDPTGLGNQTDHTKPQ